MRRAGRSSRARSTHQRLTLTLTLTLTLALTLTLTLTLTLALTLTLTKVDVVISCLASRTGSKKDSFAIDYQATLNCLDAARAAGARGAAIAI